MQPHPRAFSILQASNPKVCVGMSPLWPSLRAHQFLRRRNRLRSRTGLLRQKGKICVGVVNDGIVEISRFPALACRSRPIAKVNHLRWKAARRRKCCSASQIKGCIVDAEVTCSSLDPFHRAPVPSVVGDAGDGSVCRTDPDLADVSP